jgi:ribonuclease HI
MNPWVVYFDGLCEPSNPGGRMAWGWVIDAGPAGRFTGLGTHPPHATNTNNVAEYLALFYALAKALCVRRSLPDGDYPGVTIHGDSKLVCNQVEGYWQTRNERMASGCAACRDMLNPDLRPWKVLWVPRAQNTEADELSRRAYREVTGKEAPERHRRSA